MKKSNQGALSQLKSFRSSDSGAIKERAKAVREKVLPDLRTQLQRKEVGAARAKSFKVF